MLKKLIWWLILLKSIALISRINGEEFGAVEDDEEDNGKEADCPTNCSCLGNYVDCSNKNLTVVFKVPTWTDRLDLSSNQLTDDSLFKQLQNLTKLKQLDINHNKLTKVPSFHGMYNLNRLHLSDNQIDAISLEALAALPNLRLLDLSKNYIKEIQPDSFPSKNSIKVLNLYFNKISHLTKGTFSKLQTLQKLELSNNNLAEVQSLTFQNLNQLKTLKINFNQIKNLSDGAFHGLTSIQRLELKGNGIKSIRKAGLYNLTGLANLVLSKNLITEIETDGWEFCTRLIELDLSSNLLTNLDKNTFEGLTILRNLDLDGNNISSIGEGTFNSTPALQTLSLNQNTISWTIEDMRGPFMGLSKLQALHMSANQIKSVNKNAFLGLKSLNFLDITDNNISSIQNNAFKDMNRLNTIKLNSTNLICDCNLLWFFNWIKDHNQSLSQIEAECSYPLRLRNRKIKELQVSNLTCFDSPKPHIIDVPRSQIGIKGTNVTLSCTATSTSTESMTFSWKHDNLDVDSRMYTIKQYNADNGTIAVTELTLEDVENAAAGKYQCIVTNAYGSVYSQKIKLTVATYPKFKKTPTDIGVFAGKTAKLNCAAVGDPKPQISWEKDGGNDFPAPRERRMHVMPEDDAFFITNVKLADSGVYSCTAENPAGIIRANATLTVYEAPYFAKAMENTEAIIGQSSVLECMAAGTPKPLLQWMKDGEPILVSERHFFAAEGQLLIIVDTQITDEGNYQCIIENEYGQEKGSMSLSIVSANTKTVQIMGQNKVAAGFVNTQDMMGIVLITVVCCAVATSLIWVIIIYKTRMQNRANVGNNEGGEIDLGSRPYNQQNLVIRRSTVGNHTPFFEYLTPMRNNEMVTNVDENHDERMNNVGLFSIYVKEKENEDDFSSKDSGTGGDSSASGTEEIHQINESEQNVPLLEGGKTSEEDEVSLRIKNSHTFPVFPLNPNIQENQLNRLLLENPRLMPKPAKFRQNDDEHEFPLPPAPPPPPPLDET